MQRVTVVILDLDNTLFDWVDIWHQSFQAMLDDLIEKSGIERHVLISDFKTVFTHYGTSEYAFAIQELACLQAKHPGEDIAHLYDSSIHAFRSSRKRALKLFPDVEETLQILKDTGCLLILIIHRGARIAFEILHQATADSIFTTSASGLVARTPRPWENDETDEASVLRLNFNS